MTALLPEAAVSRLPTVGVVIPNHRRVTELRRALESVGRQTYEGQINVYLVYHPRPDIEPLLADHPEVNALSYRVNPDRAPIADQRNEGLRASDEDLVAFLDDDDLWHPEKIRLQVEAMRADRSLIATCTAWTRFLSSAEPSWDADDPDQQVDRLSHYKVVRSGLLMTSSLLVDGKAARKLELDDRPNWLGLDDYDFKLRLGELGRIGLLRRPLLALRMDPSGTSRSRPALQYARALDVNVDWLARGHKGPSDWMGFLVRCGVTAFFPEVVEDEEALSQLDTTLDGKLLGRADRWIAKGIRAAWRSQRITPAVRKLVTSRVVK